MNGRDKSDSKLNLNNCKSKVILRSVVAYLSEDVEAKFIYKFVPDIYHEKRQTRESKQIFF